MSEGGRRRRERETVGRKRQWGERDSVREIVRKRKSERERDRGRERQRE